MPLTAPQLASVVMVANSVESAMPKRTSLPSMLPPDCRSTGMLVDSREQRIALGFRPVRRGHAGQKQSAMRAQTAQPWRCEPVMRPSVYVRPAGIAKIGNHLQKIAERRGILKRMGAVGVEEPAAVGAEHLDGFLRCDRPLRDHLVGDRFHHGFAVRRHVVCIGLAGSTSLTVSYGLKFCTTPCETKSSAIDNADRQQHPENARVRSTQKLPMVSFSRREMPRMKAIASAMPTAAEAKL